MPRSPQARYCPCGGSEARSEAIAAGADGLAHLFVDEEPLEDFGALVASQKTSVIPTASVLESVCGSAFSATLLTDTRINEYLADAGRKSLRSRAQVKLQDSVKRKWVKLDVSNSGSS